MSEAKTKSRGVRGKVPRSCKFLTDAPKDKKKWDKIKYLCACGCTGEEIAAHFGVTRETLSCAIKEYEGRTFREFRREHMSYGNSQIRVKQYEKAVTDENLDMLKFLGKNRLDQSDRKTIDGHMTNTNHNTSVNIDISQTVLDDMYLAMDRLISESENK